MMTPEYVKALDRALDMIHMKEERRVKSLRFREKRKTVREYILMLKRN
jgi:hypothetical protein